MKCCAAARELSPCPAHSSQGRVHPKQIQAHGYRFGSRAALFVLAAPVERAQAVSLINPGAAQSVQDEVAPTTEVHWRRHGWGRPHWRGRHWRHHRRW
jgi:hypothetical protein